MHLELKLEQDKDGKENKEGCYNIESVTVQSEMPANTSWEYMNMDHSR